MIIKKVEFTDIFASNCYFYIDEASRHGFVIDPSAHADKLLEIIKENRWTIEKILLTHSHLDHIGAVLDLSHELNIPYYGHIAAKEYLLRPELQAHFTDTKVLKGMKYLSDAEEITLAANPNFKLKTIATEGHTLDSVVYYDEQNQTAFTGDSIFQNGIGRTDIEGSGGNYQKLMDNLQNKILKLDENTKLYPGHGPSTTVGQEKYWYQA